MALLILRGPAYRPFIETLQRYNSTRLARLLLAVAFNSLTEDGMDDVLINRLIGTSPSKNKHDDIVNCLNDIIDYIEIDRQLDTLIQGCVEIVEVKYTHAVVRSV